MKTADLSRAEIQAVEMLIETESVKIAANRLCRSHYTLQTQIKMVYEKLHISNQIALTKWYYRTIKGLQMSISILLISIHTFADMDSFCRLRRTRTRKEDYIEQIS